MRTDKSNKVDAKFIYHWTSLSHVSRSAEIAKRSIFQIFFNCIQVSKPGTVVGLDSGSYTQVLVGDVGSVFANSVVY